MDIVSLKEYLTCDSKEELTNHLMKLDASIMALHHNGFYVVNFDANNIKLYNNELSLSSFNDKIDYLDKDEKNERGNGLNPNGDLNDILEMCAIGICAYNGFNVFYTDKNFIANLIVQFEQYVKNGNVPDEMVEYYENVLLNGQIEYLNNYMYLKQNNNASSTQVSNNGNRLSKSTAIGKAFTDRDSAFVNVLLLPALIALIYLVTLVIGIIS